jgi:hypothetical protein
MWIRNMEEISKKLGENMKKVHAPQEEIIARCVSAAFRG